MKALLLLGFVLALPVAGFSQSISSTRVYRSTSPSVERVTTYRSTSAPTIEVYRDWDLNRDYIWNDRRYHWDGTAWVVVPHVVYRSRGGGFGPSSTLQDDVGLDQTPDDEVTVVRTVRPVEVSRASVAIDVQRQLQRRGYYRGPIDGIVGPGTRSAIAAFEVDNGLDPTGAVSPAVVSRLGL
jgi:hypothetical protein